MKDNCAILQRCYKSKKKGQTYLPPVPEHNWYYALLVCYEGFDEKVDASAQDESLYEIFELFTFTDFYEMIKDAYKDDPGMKFYKKFECDEYDPSDRMVPFNGLGLDEARRYQKLGVGSVAIDSDVDE